MADASAAKAKLDEISTEVGKVGEETDKLLQMVADLQTAAQNNVPDDVMDKINAVADQVKVVDEKVPDVS